MSGSLDILTIQTEYDSRQGLFVNIIKHGQSNVELPLIGYYPSHLEKCVITCLGILYFQDSDSDSRLTQESDSNSNSNQFSKFHFILIFLIPIPAKNGIISESIPGFRNCAPLDLSVSMQVCTFF